MRSLTLLVPGVLGPELPPGAPASAAGAMAHGLELPALERLLARAERLGAAGAPTRDLLALGGVDPPAAGVDLPLASIALLGEGGDPGEHWWVRADPVHLRADLADLVLLDPAELDLERDDASRLAAALDAHFAEDDLQLDVRAPGRWYLRLPGAEGLATRPPGECVGRPVSDSLPRGSEAMRWHARINEAQMVLHASDVNRERGARGLTTVNSIWPWGCGVLPARPQRCSVDTIVGAGEIGRGLARLARAGWKPLPEHLGGLDVQGHTVVVIERLGAAAHATDVERWRARLAQFEAAWMVPARDALGARRLEWVELRCEQTGCLRLTRAGARRFWRRSRSIAELIGARAAAGAAVSSGTA